MSGEAWTTSTASAAETIEFYYHVESRGERLRKWSNDVADSVGRAIDNGVDDAAWATWAELADELARVADFIDPVVPIESLAWEGEE